MKIRTYPLLFTDCQNSVGKYFWMGVGQFLPPRVVEDPQNPGLLKIMKFLHTPAYPAPPRSIRY